MKPRHLQEYLLEIVLNQYAKRSEAVDALAELFDIGKDAIYRRMRGDTLLTPDEIKTLARKYHISLDAYVFENNNTTFFSYNQFTRRILNFEDYLDDILQDLHQISKLPNPQIYYASAEIPIFHHCFFPELIHFKLYVWGRTIWDFDYLNDRPFDFDLIPPSVTEMTEQILKLYRDIPSIEIWSMNIMDFTLSQIEFHVISGGFRDKNDALLLCDRLIDLVNHLRLMAENGKQFLMDRNPAEAAGASFNLYHNEMVYTNNTIMVNTDAGSAVYTAFGNPNFLKSTDQKMCDYTNGWFKKMFSKSESISQTGEKSRAWFFNGLRRKIENAKKRIALQIGEE